MLERVVGEVPGACALGEVVHLWERALRDDQLCGCGQAFSRCPFWREVGERAFGGWSSVDVGWVLRLKLRVDRNRYVPRLALWGGGCRRKELTEYLDLYERVYAAAAEISGAEVVVDSSKHASLAFCLRHSRRVQLMVIHLARDIPAVAYSWSRTVERPEITERIEHMPRLGAVRVVAWWSAFNIMLLLLRRLGVRSLLVRYEDFVREPEVVVRGLVAAAGLATAGVADVFSSPGVAHLSGQHIVAGNPMRFRHGDITLRPDDTWRSRMPRATRLLVEVLGAPLRIVLGYGVRRRDSGVATTTRRLR